MSENHSWNLYDPHSVCTNAVVVLQGGGVLVWLVLLLPDFELLTGKSFMLRRPLQNKQDKKRVISLKCCEK